MILFSTPSTPSGGPVIPTSVIVAVPPDASEGFDAAYEVVATPEGGFAVTPRPDLSRGAP